MPDGEAKVARNHNPRVGGSSPSSGIAKPPINTGFRGSEGNRSVAWGPTGGQPRASEVALDGTSCGPRRSLGGGPAQGWSSRSASCSRRIASSSSACWSARRCEGSLTPGLAGSKLRPGQGMRGKGLGCQSFVSLDRAQHWLAGKASEGCQLSSSPTRRTPPDSSRAYDSRRRAARSSRISDELRRRRMRAGRSRSRWSKRRV
jgi:hypothetical protein